MSTSIERIVFLILLSRKLFVLTFGIGLILQKATSRIHSGDWIHYNSNVKWKNLIFTKFKFVQSHTFEITSKGWIRECNNDIQNKPLDSQSGCGCLLFPTSNPCSVKSTIFNLYFGCYVSQYCLPVKQHHKVYS